MPWNDGTDRQTDGRTDARPFLRPRSAYLLSDKVLVCVYLSAATCRLFAYGPAEATASQNPIISCLIQIQIVFTFLVPAYPGSPGKEAVKRVQ